MFHHRLGQGLEPFAQPFQRLFPGAGSAADGDRVGRMGLLGRPVLRQGGATPLQPGDFLGQFLQALAGGVLLVGVVLLQDGQALDLGVRLGQRQHGGVAGGDGLDLGVGELLAADVLGLADGEVAGHHLGDEPGFGLQRLPHIGVETRLR